MDSLSAGINADGTLAHLERRDLVGSLTLKLMALGATIPEGVGDSALVDLTGGLFKRYREQRRLLSQYLSPADKRIQDFLDDVLGAETIRLPTQTLTLDRYGLARELSFPLNSEEWHNDHISSYRLSNGVLHNPLNDRRTTKGVFQIADYGLPVPADKIAVPLSVYAHLLRAAVSPPSDMTRLPFASQWRHPVETIVSLLLRPLVCPEVPGVTPESRMEIRFFAPGGLVSNLDFVESIFGNAGDPWLPENDAALDSDHWTGHTGCVILAPHLSYLKKRDVGLPRVVDASDAQKAHRQCWTDEHELYNDGKPFKITLRDMRGIMVTILADNYFGYCKKEVKTQIGFSANLSGLAEEEHAGGTLAFSTFSLGKRFVQDSRIMSTDHRYADVLRLMGETIVAHETGYATDKRFPTIHYLPEDMSIDVETQEITWTSRGQHQSLRILPDYVYVHPSGYKVRIEQHPMAPSWRLVGTVPEGTFCHKPSTVSGGGKSEISKSLVDAALYGPVYVRDFEGDMDLVGQIVARDYSASVRPERRQADKDYARPLLSSDRSLGSVIKLLTPNAAKYTDDYNAWLTSIPNHVRAAVFIMKRFYNPAWGDDWRSHFGVDIVNGAPGHELKLDGRKLVGTYLRIGLSSDGSWRTYKLRQDFIAADKVQMEDDITASVVVPAERLSGLPPEYDAHPSLKLSENCEYRLFQRPDDAIHPGFDKQTEMDMADGGLFASNFQPLSVEEVRDLATRLELRSAFTKPMGRHIERNASRTEGFTVCSAKPRLVGGKPTKNPRYLQVRRDLARPRDRYLAEVGARLYRRIPVAEPVVFPVISVLSGRRNNRPEQGIRPLCVYSPIHYQELPELFMDYICSVTGKSPSTTGAGSEGALTKGPFNAISATADLNNALVSMLLCGYSGFSTAAGWVGPHNRVDHDISLLIPEVWCRLFPAERDPERMIARGHLKKLEDYDFEGRRVRASLLGYRITSRFVHTFFGRVFDNPGQVFSKEILKPELQDPAVFADGVDNVAQAYREAALLYFEDGSVEDACPPIGVLLHIMAHGQWEGREVSHPDVRGMFTRERLLASAWYARRLRVKQARDVALWRRHVASLSEFLAKSEYDQEAERLGLRDRLAQAERRLQQILSDDYLEWLAGTIGADPIHATATTHPRGPDTAAPRERVVGER
jgi:hypothetical protein